MQSPFNTGDSSSQQAESSQQKQYFEQPCEPWTLDSMPWKLASTTLLHGGVMQFRANTEEDAFKAAARSLQHKRKSNELPPISPKQFISEEKITAHFNGLYISGSNREQATTIYGGLASDDTPSTSKGKTDSNPAYQVAAQELEEKLRNANRIILCDELKKFQEKRQQSHLIPEALFNYIQKPCTALVLWQPPPIDCDMLMSTNQMGTSKNYSIDQPNRLSVDDDDLEEYSDAEIDDFIDNNNTCSMDFNNIKADSMEEDL